MVGEERPKRSAAQNKLDERSTKNNLEKDEWFV
jgi:hypothetical protein